MGAPTISGYTTNYNCIASHYPFELSIRSMLDALDEVVVVDAGSTDGTLERLYSMQRQDSRLKVFVEPVDFSHPRWAIHSDGYLKAKARARCTGDFCWQMDSDEIIRVEDYEKIRRLPQHFKGVGVVMLPMIEFWGSFERVRADFLSWKIRFSKNDPLVTHGIPRSKKMFDAQGHEYPRPYDSDSCNYLFKETQEDMPFDLYLPPGFENFCGVSDPRYPACFEAAVEALPAVYHLSWLDLPRKIRHYKSYWPKFHRSMYNQPFVDTAEANVMFDKPWSEVTEDDIQALAATLKVIGPRSFHKKLDRNKIGKTIPWTRPIPDGLRVWAAENEAESDARGSRDLTFKPEELARYLLA